MHPVLVFVTSQNKKDILINAKNASDITHLALKPIHLNDGLEHSCAKNLINEQPNRYIEYYTFCEAETSRNELLGLLASLKNAFLESSSENASFTSLAFAAALLYPEGKAAAFLDVIACPHASNKHLSYESNDGLQTAIFGAISQQNLRLNYAEMAKNLTLLLSK